jgi:hypothetical protein
MGRGDERIAFEKTLGVLLLELEQLTSGTTDFGKGEGDSPDFALVSQAVFACSRPFSISSHCEAFSGFF